MAQVYRAANYVMVLEDSLQQCTIRASPEAILIRIYSSP